MAAEHVAARARGAQRRAIDDQGPRVGLLDVDDAHHHRLDFRLDVVGLVDRQAWQWSSAADELAEHQEQLERVDRADDQIVVRVLAVVEMEAAETLLGREDRDDLLDVDALGVVAQVDEHAGALAEALADEQRRAPVGEVGGVERGLEELVLDEQLLLRRERGVGPLERVEHALTSLDQVVLARVVRPVREPQRLRRRAEHAGDLDALEQVRLGLAADRRVRVRDRAELVVGILEEVRVDRADAEPGRADMARELRGIGHGIPREVERHRAGRAGQPVHLGGIVDALEDGARPARLREHTEARAGIAVAPRRGLDHERAERGLGGVDVHAALAQARSQLIVLGPRGHAFVLS